SSRKFFNYSLVLADLSKCTGMRLGAVPLWFHGIGGNASACRSFQPRPPNRPISNVYVRSYWNKLIYQTKGERWVFHGRPYYRTRNGQKHSAAKSRLLLELERPLLYKVANHITRQQQCGVEQHALTTWL